MLKRCFDITFALAASILLMLPLLLIAAVIVIKDPGNPFYWQTRIGQHGQAFRLLKLRSMRKDADQLESFLSPEQMHTYKTEYKLADDPRLIGYRKAGDGTRCFGSMLRRCSVDELPQLVWNVLIKGDMSVIGPRPILREELDQHYTAQEQALLLSVKPGVTGYWQAYARNHAHYSTGERQQMELYYAQHMGPMLDFKILLATIGAVLRKSGM